LSPGLYYARLTQRLVGALTAPTKAGRLYEVDLRLRPSGRKGPLATSLAAFELYQREEAETWEHMALTRARVVAGEPTLARDFEAAVRRALTKKRARKTLAREIADMRGLIAREKGDKGAFDLKLAPGGLIDVEFIAQYLALAHGGADASLLRTNPRETLAAAREAGFLGAGDAEALAQAHRLLTAVTQILRLTLPDDAAPQEAAAGVKRRIAAAAGAPDFERLTLDLAEARKGVRERFVRIVGAL
jgi:glutamate-ammonia-ligase adenylyltransferase